MPTGHGSEAGLRHRRTLQEACELLSPPQHCPRGSPGGQGGASCAPAQRGRAPQAPLGVQGQAGRAPRVHQGCQAGGQLGAGVTRIPLPLLQPPCALPALPSGRHMQGPLSTSTGSSPQHRHAEGLAGGSGGAGLCQVGVPHAKREQGALGAAGPAPRLQVSNELPWALLPARERPAQGHRLGRATSGRELGAEAVVLDTPD